MRTYRECFTQRISYIKKLLSVYKFVLVSPFALIYPEMQVRSKALRAGITHHSDNISTANLVTHEHFPIRQMAKEHRLTRIRIYLNLVSAFLAISRHYDSSVKRRDNRYITLTDKVNAVVIILIAVQNAPSERRCHSKRASERH